MNPDSDNSREKKTPPNRALIFLRWFCREDYLEEIKGDLVEIFEMQSEESLKKAKRKFTWSVLKYFRPIFMKSFKSFYQPNFFAMFRHNFLLAFRTSMRYKMSFIINLVGLSSGLACALFIYLWVQDELSVDKFHTHDAQLFQVMENQAYSNGIETTPSTPGLLEETLMEEVVEVEYGVTTSWIDTYTLFIAENKSNADGICAAEHFFKIFSYPLLTEIRNKFLMTRNPS